MFVVYYLSMLILRFQGSGMGRLVNFGAISSKNDQSIRSIDRSIDQSINQSINQTAYSK